MTLVSLPLYVRHRRDGSQKKTGAHHVRLLFYPDIGDVVRPELAQAIGKLRNHLMKHFTGLGREIHHRELLHQTFSPLLKTHRFRFKIELRCGILNIAPLLVIFPVLDKTLAFFPAYPGFWFVVPEQGELEGHAEENLTRFLRAEEKEEEIDDPEAFAIEGKEWITQLDLNLPGGTQKAPKESGRLFLGSLEKVDGAEELHKVGTCLDWAQHQTPEPYCHPKVLEEMNRLAQRKPFPPLLIIGKSGVGKTALVHQWVAGRAKRERQKRGNTWHLSPQRLISGMSYVGQWENRVLAIFKHMENKGHFFYCDDLPALFHAGLSAQSDLSVALVLKTFLEEGKLNFIGEISPERWRKLQEWDRGFSDLFHCIRLEEPTPKQTMTTLLIASRLLEQRHQMMFQQGALQQIIQLAQRFEGDRVFPGRAMGILEYVAQKNAHGNIGRNQVTADYQKKSGLQAAFVDDKTALTRKTVEGRLLRNVVGQDAAVTAVADVILRAKARLNDPGKPFGTLLFLGPTGVGKTQLAKTCARYLYGEESRFLRFDMNEFNSSDAAARLVGDFHHPNGLLTQAVRQNPFSVVLFDEIEKAHPNVYDLLLQVLGEARLTDANGMTVSFQNTIVILTSNLGAKEAGNTLGFGGARNSEAVYRGAARRFFRPEFFNRLDAVVPFQNLERRHMRTIAELQANALLRREGFKRRRCTIRLEHGFLDSLAQRGYHPQLGARALKRTLERDLTFPLGRVLSNSTPGTPLILRIGSDADQAFSFQSYELHNRARRCFDIPDTPLEAAKDRIDQLEKQVAAFAPEGETSISDLSDSVLYYYGLREMLEQCRGHYAEAVDFEKRLLEPTSSPVRSAMAKPIPRDKHQIINLPPDIDVDALLIGRDITLLLRQWRDTYGPISDPIAFRRQSRQRRLWQSIALTARFLTEENPRSQRVLLLRLPLARGENQTTPTGAADYSRLFEAFANLHLLPGIQGQDVPLSGVFLEGCLAEQFAAVEQGIHLELGEDGERIYLVFSIPVPDSVTDCKRWFNREWSLNHEAALDKAFAYAAEHLPDGRLPGIVRYHHRLGVYDVGSGLFTPTGKPIETYYQRAMLLNMIGRETGGCA